MKKTFLSLLASSLCFVGVSPVFAGTTPIAPGNCILYGNFGSGNSDGGKFDIMSRTKVLITLEGQKFILGELNSKSLPGLNPLSQGNPAIKDFIFLLTGDKGKVGANSPDINTAQANLVNKLSALGLDLGEGRPARQLTAALTLLIPFGNEASPSEDNGVAAVDGTKFYQAITAFNALITELTTTASGTGPEAAKAQATLNALLKDETFNSISSTLRALREQLKDKEKETR